MLQMLILSSSLEFKTLSTSVLLNTRNNKQNINLNTYVTRCSFYNKFLKLFSYASWSLSVFSRGLACAHGLNRISHPYYCT
jgi:hypothetical protein